MSKFELDEDLVRKLSQLLVETGLTEIEYQAQGRRIRVARNQAPAYLPAAAALPGVSAEAPETARGAEAALANAVTSPMVGTVYVAPEPSAPPFVGLGDSVTVGQTLLIVEAMKVMNPIVSPRAGKVTQILVHDGQPVEYGEPLLVIE